MPVAGYLSVVVPALNEAKNIRACLHSALAYSECSEVIIVDCRSEDGTASIAHQVAMEDSRVQVLTSPERSYAAAVSTGVNAASHELIQILDGDSTLSPDWIEAALSAIGRGADVVRGEIELLGPTGIIRRAAGPGGPALYRAQTIMECNYDPRVKVASDIDVRIRTDIAGFRTDTLPMPMMRMRYKGHLNDSPRKAARRGYHAGLALVERSSYAYSRRFIELRGSYPAYAAFVALGVALLLARPRIAAVLWSGPLVARLLYVRERERERCT